MRDDSLRCIILLLLQSFNASINAIATGRTPEFLVNFQWGISNFVSSDEDTIIIIIIIFSNFFVFLIISCLMPQSIWSVFTSSSSSSSSSATTSPSNSPRKDYLKRILNRQRKLRYVTEDGLGLCPQSTPVSPDDGSESRSPHHWSKSAVPLPLPLPELISLQRNCNSSSPTKEGPSRGAGDPSSPPVSRYFFPLIPFFTSPLLIWYRNFPNPHNRIMNVFKLRFDAMFV